MFQIMSCLSVQNTMGLFLVNLQYTILTAETLVHEPQVIKDRDSSQRVRIAVIAHPWSLLGILCNKISNL
jgi:hypothetical protein